MVLIGFWSLKSYADIAHFLMFTCMFAHCENASRRCRSLVCWLSACLGLSAAVNSDRSSANPAELDVSYVVVIPTPVSCRNLRRELMNRQKMRGDSTAPCFTPRLRGMGAVVPTSLEE